MLRILTFPSVAICAACLLASSLRFDQTLVAHGQRASLDGRDFGDQPVPRYQSGHLFSVDGSLSSIWVESVSGTHPGPSLDRAITLPDSTQVLVDDVAVSFDGDIAVSTDAMDRHGRLVSVIAWLAADGSHRSHATICALRHRFHCGRVIVGGWNRETGPLNRASIPQPAAPLRCCRPSGPLAPPLDRNSPTITGILPLVPCWLPPDTMSHSSPGKREPGPWCRVRESLLLTEI